MSWTGLTNISMQSLRTVAYATAAGQGYNQTLTRPSPEAAEYRGRAAVYVLSLRCGSFDSRPHYEPSMYRDGKGQSPFPCRQAVSGRECLLSRMISLSVHWSSIKLHCRSEELPTWLLQNDDMLFANNPSYSFYSHYPQDHYLCSSHVTCFLSDSMATFS
jgi:hypothetical protein